MTNPPPLPRYGEASLADLLPSLLAALDVPGAPNPLGVEPLRRVCLLVVDGLGWDLLLANRQAAPFLAAAAEQAVPLTHGLPETTATRLASIGTGRPPGGHGLVGYTMALPGMERAFNCLRWSPYGLGGAKDLRDRVVPERLQPQPTGFERAEADGVEVTLVGAGEYAASGWCTPTIPTWTGPGTSAASPATPGGWSSPTSTGWPPSSPSGCPATPPWSSPATTAWSTCGRSSAWTSPTSRSWPPACGCWPARPAPATSTPSEAPPPTSWTPGGRCWVTTCGWCPVRRRWRPAGSARRCRTRYGNASATWWRPRPGRWGWCNGRWTPPRRCSPATTAR